MGANGSDPVHPTLGVGGQGTVAPWEARAIKQERRDKVEIKAKALTIQSLLWVEKTNHDYYYTC